MPVPSVALLDWVRAVFDHPPNPLPWHWSPRAAFPELGAIQALEYARTLFEDAGTLLAPFCDVQVDRGLDAIISNGVSDYMVGLNDRHVPTDLVVSVILSFRPLFEHLFVTRCYPALAHLAEPSTSALNSVCYMWWDTLPLSPQPEAQARRQVDETALSVMASTLTLPNLACQESALHGLGHWALDYPEQVRDIITRFLRTAPALRRELREYAECACEGRVQ
jgi:hypothetical protein